MGYVQRIQGFLVKQGYNFERSDINLTNFHAQLYVMLATEGIFTGNKNSYIRFIIPLSGIGVTLVGVALEVLNIYRGVSTSDYSIACESFCYLVFLGAIVTVYSGFLLNKRKILTQVEQMDADFKYVCSLGPRYREPFLESQLLVWKLFVGWACFMTVIGGSFMLYPIALLVLQSLLAIQDENTIRSLVFPVWLPKDDPYRTPNYEMFFILEMYFIFTYVLSFVGYIYTLFHFLLHCYIMLDMIMLDFEVIFEGLDESVASLPKNDSRRIAIQVVLKKRLKRIVNWHISVLKALKTVSSVFRMSLVYQIMLSSVAICLTAYRVSEKLDHGEFDVLFTMLGMAAVLQLWIPCYLGTILRNKGFAVADACWGCGWHETPLGSMIRADIVNIIVRAQVPLHIRYTGQPVIQLETFSAIISTSYSYFNMLRQSTKIIKD